MLRAIRVVALIMVRWLQGRMDDKSFQHPRVDTPNIHAENHHSMSDPFRQGRPDLRSATRAIQYFFWHNYKASLHAQTSGPIHRVYLEKTWNEREKSGLWCMVACPQSICSKSTVRRHHMRRLRDAFKKALNAQGWDEYGKSIDRQASSLHGTLHLMAQRQIIQTNSPDLQKECASVVSKILELNRQGPPKDKRLDSGSGNRTPNQGGTKTRTQNHDPRTARPSKSHVKKAHSPLGITLNDIRRTQSQQHSRKV